jgi:glycosyltransferase involved in cell wall biosynthesis
MPRSSVPRRPAVPDSPAAPTRPRISVLTPCFNSAESIGALIASLRAQTDRDFEWVVADGASSDRTLELLAGAADLGLSLSSQRDFGIYDALNRAIRNCSGEYYIVAGSDDVFAPDAIAQFRKAIETSGADVVVAVADHPHGRAYIKKGPSWIVGEKAFIANHSLATAFRKSLHERFGWYSNRFPIAADSLFVLRSCKGGARRHVAAFTAGTVGGGGVSYVDWAGSATELFRVQLIVGCALFPQVVLLLLRILKGSSLRLRRLHDRAFR